MSAFQIIREVCITTPIPSNMDSSQVIIALHNHEDLINLNPHVISFESIESTENMKNYFKLAFPDLDPTGPIVAYHVHQDVPLYGSTTLLAIFSNQPNGVNSIADAPLGLRLSNSWRVLPDDRDTQRMVLREDCMIHSSVLLLPLMSTVIIPEWKKAHQATHIKLLETISAASSTSEPTISEGENQSSMTGPDTVREVHLSGPYSE